MERILHVPVIKRHALYLIVVMAFSLIGCTMVGKVVQVDNQILFGNEERKQGIFTQGGLTVNYSYRLTGGNITMEGQVDFSGRVDSLNVHLLFVDGSGTVLLQKILYSSGYRDSSSWMAGRTFQKTMIVPTEAKGLSFSYSVQPYRGQR